MLAYDGVQFYREACGCGNYFSLKFMDLWFK
jgi:hypothetical protein